METPSLRDAVTLAQDWANVWRSEMFRHQREGLPWEAARDKDRAAVLEQFARELQERQEQR